MRRRAAVLALLLTLLLPAPALAQEEGVCPNVSYVASEEDEQGPPDVPVTIEGGSDVQPARTPDRWTLTRMSPGPQELVATVEGSRSFSFTIRVSETSTFRIDAVGPQGCDGASARFTRTVTSSSPAPTATPAYDCGARVEPRSATVDSWGLDGLGGATVTVHGSRRHPGSSVRVIGYTRPSTEYRELATVKTDANSVAQVHLPLQGNTRLYAIAEHCVFTSDHTILTVKPRIGGLMAHREGIRLYSFSAFYQGPGNKVVNLYRVTAEGREVLTSQTRSGGELLYIRRQFTGSGRFGFVLRTGEDISSLGTSSNVRDTVIH